MSRTAGTYMFTPNFNTLEQVIEDIVQVLHRNPLHVNSTTQLVYYPSPLFAKAPFGILHKRVGEELGRRGISAIGGWLSKYIVVADITICIV